MTSNPPDSLPVPPGVVVVPVPGDAAGRAALTARVTALAEVRHPHLVAVLAVQAARDGALDVEYARGEAADLPAVLAVRGRLAPGEAAAVGVHVAQALAALHAAGLVHGPVEPGDVVLRPGGAPALRAHAAAPPEEWNPAEDVRAAARLVDSLLGSHPLAGAPGADGDPLTDPDGALRRALEPALGADARRRPEAGTLAALVDAACEPTMVRLPDPATLAGAALAGARRGAVAGVAVGPSRRRFRGTRTVGARAVSGRPSRRPGRGTSPRGGGLGPRVRGGLRPGALRPVVVVVGIGLTVGLMTGAVLAIRDRADGPAGSAAVAASADGSSAASADRGSAASPERGGAASAAPTGPQAAAPTGPQAAGAPASPMAAGSTVEPNPVSTPVSADPLHDRQGPGKAAGALTQRRLDMLAEGGGDPGEVDLAGSAAYRADAAFLAELQGAGTRPDKPRAAVARTEVVQADEDSATVRIEYVVEAHEQVTADGTRTSVPASARQTATLTLAWTDAGWRVTDVA